MRSLKVRYFASKVEEATRGAFPAFLRAFYLFAILFAIPGALAPDSSEAGFSFPLSSTSFIFKRSFYFLIFLASFHFSGFVTAR